MIARLQSHPLKRALRADKMTLAALEATLRLYLHPEALSEKLRQSRRFTRSAEVIQIQAQRLQAPLAAHYGAEVLLAVEVMPCLSQYGSGSLPVDRLPSAALTFTPHDGRGSHLESLAARWRELPVPVIGRIYDGRSWLDLRCLEDEQRFLEMLFEMIIATAGHVDHGKTTLLQAITGVNADRLPEEKARHDHRFLGYAYWPQPDGRAPFYRRSRS